jgi:hypothetical protein
MQYNIKVIPHEDQRYETVGDYFIDDGITYIRVSDMGNDDYAFLVILHEMIEQYLCLKRGIKEEDITSFDIEFESKRQEGNYDEPGDDIDAPYQNEHLIATGVEKILCGLLNIKWSDYDKTVINL